MMLTKNFILIIQKNFYLTINSFSGKNEFAISRIFKQELNEIIRFRA